MQILGFRGLGLKGFKVKVSGCDLSRGPQGGKEVCGPQVGQLSSHLGSNRGLIDHRAADRCGSQGCPVGSASRVHFLIVEVFRVEGFESSGLGIRVWGVGPRWALGTGGQDAVGLFQRVAVVRAGPTFTGSPTSAQGLGLRL